LKNSPNKLISDVKIGKDVKIYDFVNLYGCEIGDETMIGTFVEIQRNAKIGKRCRIQSHTFICEGVVIEDDVMVAHGAMFINDREPLVGREWVCEPTLVKSRAAIGTNATILCGVVIGEGALIGAGAVVTKDVPDNMVVVGNPAKVLRRVRNG
jgi:UDP-2-acetamido-3-amino-2,3-dideoxy-glucuronate N-acetyltransferase